MITPKLKTRLYSPKLKRGIIAADAIPLASVTCAAIAHGSNNNTFHCWLREPAGHQLVAQLHWPAQAK